MLFASLSFLSLFLPILCIAYFFVKTKWHNLLLLVASFFFYAWGEPTYLVIMLFTVISNYFFAIAIEKWEAQKKIILFLAIFTNLSFLCYFKYFNFLSENLSLIFSKNFDFIDVVMPIGISFYTFQAISYVVDVYRKETKAQRNFYDLALYISFFPQLIAGPIVKYHDIESQITKRTLTVDKIDYGIRRFILGLAKKVLIANTMGNIADQVFALPPNEASVALLWLGVICYAFQLYYDFSGYSDMAIGLASIFGFTLLENFNYPYISQSITEFWRRWHISLSTWFKEYLYIPLGGNRAVPYRIYFNLFIVFLCTGFWHGASWNFIVWGLLHGVFIIFERISGFYTSRKNVFTSCLARIYTLFIVLVGWVFFRAVDLSTAISFLEGMFGLHTTNTLYTITSIENINNKFYVILFVAGVSSMPIFRTYFFRKLSCQVVACLNYIYLLCLFLFTISSIAASTYNPFIYFRF